ncbi:MAG: hypothetical protein EBR23_12625 [Planctomycetia bacterium]|nr:hypothetical protein [Planctomycetia bacterium]
MMSASGTAAVLDLAAVPIHADAARMSGLPGDGRSPLEHALGDGEDFELVLALDPTSARDLVAASGRPPLDVPVTVIGEVVEGRGLFARTADGGREQLKPRGFVHDFGP